MRSKKPSGRFSMILKIWREFLSGLNLWFSSEPKVGKTALVAELAILALPLLYVLFFTIPWIASAIFFALEAIANISTFAIHGLYIHTDRPLTEKEFILASLAKMGINVSFIEFIALSLMLPFLLSVYSQLMRGVFIKNIVYYIAVPAFGVALYHAQFDSANHFVAYVINRIENELYAGESLTLLSASWICFRFGYFYKFVACFFMQEACELAVFKGYKYIADIGYISSIAGYLGFEYFFFSHGA